MSTPMRRQYLQIKKQYPDAILFFRLGDFYETFDEDAKTVAEVCDVMLTSRPTSSTTVFIAAATRSSSCGATNSARALV